ncbi:5-formyltetrahydrofolate cyclo-ligase [Streptomyces sp. NP160]|uniref:5-formyltetrahydrofolate cyclo-ligase n=1 Tax=Streptomyces sp. NP160 TaxID=2586637 RepID=UPI001118BC26|nr:5-formyltetrahydrofolate cyclo-ligase [Streptomyces sp. NP160]TNM66986.1 5-formyltetrahydrofolate cyclo-ligase [Streptomyces sp. NP160]
MGAQQQTRPAQPALDKAALRAGVRAARRALDDDERAGLDAALARAALADGSPLRDLGPGAVVALYESLPTEPGTRGLRAALAARGVVVVLPVVVGAAPLGWVLDAPGSPARPEGLDGADAVLLPALAVDRSGTRLGQGGGHYDRTLALLPPEGAPGRPLLAAVVREPELLGAGELPREPHDVGVDAALTPAGWTRLR